MLHRTLALTHHQKIFAIFSTARKKFFTPEPIGATPNHPFFVKNIKMKFDHRLFGKIRSIYSFIKKNRSLQVIQCFFILKNKSEYLYSLLTVSISNACLNPDGALVLSKRISGFSLYECRFKSIPIIFASTSPMWSIWGHKSNQCSILTCCFKL